MTSRLINTNLIKWEEEAINLAFSSHLICTGSVSNLQWFGTQLIQLLGQKEDTKTSSIYGKLAINFDDFCYQFCHSTPWGFEMGRNMNAVVDVIRGETNSKNKFFIFYDANYMYQDDFQRFQKLIDIFFRTAKDQEAFNQNIRVIILLEENEKISLRRLLRHTEKYPIEILKIVHQRF